MSKSNFPKQLRAALACIEALKISSSDIASVIVEQETLGGTTIQLRPSAFLALVLSQSLDPERLKRKENGDCVRVSCLFRGIQWVAWFAIASQAWHSLETRDGELLQKKASRLAGQRKSPRLLGAREEVVIEA
ncbi:hypothetical protein VN12_06535 [Pirellula sp. SH-Sr6A]|uniref:hypothetical protein n=1 Tax=Pirellula sp. SH-Sr6A TaxID=1632865 RepID=UPI00078BE5BA|nr:hypothetical protein [Pirellula sp. SH-Sr6A]AMV31759.1 hypothetical protein VN12_06535 [Pirellula sp. SH-Sr6A]